MAVIDNNTTTVKTTLSTLVSGSSENNRTAFVLNNDGNTTEFRIGDITNSNNSVYLK